MSITIDIIRKFDDFGLQEVIEEYTKEDIDFAIKAEVKENIKAKLKIISANWNAAEKLLGAIKTLCEVISPEDEDDNEDLIDFEDSGVERDFDDYEDDEW